MSADRQTAYEAVKDIPTDELASRVVSSLIMAKGNLNKYESLIAMLIRELRGEPHPRAESASANE